MYGRLIADTSNVELQIQYQSYKNNLQQLAQKIGDVEQETEEHKYACSCRVLATQFEPV